MRLLQALFVMTAAFAALPGQSAAQLAQQNMSATWSRSPLRVGSSLPLRVSWSRSDIMLASAFTASLMMDAGQTRGLARAGWQGFHETNPLLGRYPSVARINVYTAVAGLTVLGAAAALPPRVRPWFLGAALVIEAFTVARNAHAGITIGLP